MSFQLKLRILVSCLLLAALCLPFLIVPDVHSQTAATTTMTIVQPPQGQCSVLPLGFSARTGQVIGGTFGANVAIDLYIVSQKDYVAFNKTSSCAFPASTRPLFVETNVVGTHNSYGTPPIPADGTYYFIFIYRNTGFAQLANNYVIITLTFPSSLVEGNTIVTTVAPPTATSQLTSIASNVISTASIASSSLSSTLTPSSSSSLASSIFVTTSIASPIASSTETQTSSGAVPVTSLFLVIAVAIVACGGLIGGIIFRSRKRHALSSYLTKIDSTYNQYAVDREECRSQLERLKRDAIDMLKNGKIDEGHFLMLDEKISQYLKDLTNTKQRSVDQTESGEATFCKNCGTRLADDEKLCRKCGTKR